MQLDWDDHFREIVVPACENYLAAERPLSEATASKDRRPIDRARFDTLREAAGPQGGSLEGEVHASRRCSCLADG